MELPTITSQTDAHDAARDAWRLLSLICRDYPIPGGDARQPALAKFEQLRNALRAVENALLQAGVITREDMGIMGAGVTTGVYPTPGSPT